MKGNLENEITLLNLSCLNWKMRLRIIPTLLEMYSVNKTFFFLMWLQPPHMEVPCRIVAETTLNSYVMSHRGSLTTSWNNLSFGGSVLITCALCVSSLQQSRKCTVDPHPFHFIPTQLDLSNLPFSATRWCSGLLLCYPCLIPSLLCSGFMVPSGSPPISCHSGILMHCWDWFHM